MSDFLSEGYEDSVKLISKIHDLRLISVRDRLEKDIRPPISGIFNFKDLETGEPVRVEIKKDDQIKTDSKIQRLAETLGTWFCDLSPSDDYLDKLIKKLKSRRR